MKIAYNGRTVTVTASTPGERVRGGSWGSLDSAFWGRLRDLVRDPVFDRPARREWIRACPGKDGHLTGAPYYLTRRDRSECIHDPYYAVRSAGESFNNGESVTLAKVKTT